MEVHVTWSKAGEPIGSATEPMVVSKSTLRVSHRGAVYIYISVPVIITDDDGKPLLRTLAAGSLILRAAPILD